MILGLTLPYLWIRLMRNPVGWIIEYIWTTRHLLLLFFLWILCTLAAVLLVTNRSAKASTAYRKYFHALIVIVFTSGVFIGKRNFQLKISSLDGANLEHKTILFFTGPWMLFDNITTKNSKIRPFYPKYVLYKMLTKVLS